MDIRTAALEAQARGTGIYRASDDEAGTYIVPTNTEACCILASISEKRPAKRWQPNLNDLLAEDWEVYGHLGDEFRQEIDNAK